MAARINPFIPQALESKLLDGICAGRGRPVLKIGMEFDSQ
jgi:hypothetical protein